jgi:hypothetical protein
LSERLLQPQSILWKSKPAYPQLPPLIAVEFYVLTLLSKSRWDYRTAAHLLNRAAFGGTPEVIAATTAKVSKGPCTI